MANTFNHNDKVVITDGGNVGIGTTNPDRGLTISRSNQYASLNIYKANTTNQIVYLGTGSSGTDDDTILQLFDEATEKVRIFTAGSSWFNGGNVGIGTTSPTSLLHLSSNNSTYEANGVLSVSGGVNAVFNSTERFIFNIDSDNTQTDRTFDIAANTTGSSGGTLLFRVQENGNVGIGTTSPAGVLDVQKNNTGDQLVRFWNTNTAGTGSSVVRIANSGNNNNGSRIEFTDQQYYVATISADRSQGIIFRTSATGTDPVAIAERMRITSAGNVGIGTTAPQAPLHVIAASNNNNALIQEWSYTSTQLDIYSLMLKQTVTSGVVRYNFSMVNNGTAYNDVLVLDRGNVGIGTTSPGVKLDVFASANSQFRISATDASPTTIMMDTTTGSTDRVRLKNDAGAFKIAVQNSSDVLTITSAGSVGIGTTNPGSSYSEKLQISNSDVGRINITHTNVGSSRQSDILFTENSTLQGQIGTILGNVTYEDQFWIRGIANIPLTFLTNSAERMRITSAGNVGIGTTSPTSKLNIVSTSNDPDALTVQDDARKIKIGRDSVQVTDLSDSGTNLYLNGGGGNVSIPVSSLGIGTNSPSKSLHVASGNNEGIFMQGTANGGHWFDFKSANSNLWSMGAQPGHMGWYNRTDSTYKMVITDGGNVGIGTTSPGNKLHVVGSATVSTSILVPGASTANALMHRFGTSGGSGSYTTLDVIKTADTSGDFVFMAYAAGVAASTSSPKLIFGHYDATPSNGAVMTIDTSNERVGIGTTTPSTVLNIYRNNTLLLPQLRVENDGTGDAAMSFVATGVAGWAVGLDNSDGDKFKISRSTGDVGTNTAFTIDGSGNVGIGTTVPGAKLEVFGTGNTLRLDSAENGSKEILFRNVGTGTATIKTDGDLKLYVEDAGKNILFDTTGGEKMRITSAGNVGIGTTSPVSSANSIFTTTNGTNASGYITQVNGTTSMYVYSIAGESRISEQRNLPLVFETNGTEKVRFTSGGNVGIGTTSPANKLEVSVLGYGFRHYGDASNYLRTYVGSSYQILDNGTNQFGYFNGKFYVQTGGTDKLTIDTSGNVGIGTTSPAYKLEVSGGAISIKGNAAGNSLRFDDSGGTSRNAMYLDTSNYLNVGNSSYAGIKLYHTATAPQANGLEGNQIAEGYGITENGKVLAEPNAWLAVRIGTTDYAIPMYTAG